jgi:hypothetical protein
MQKESKYRELISHQQDSGLTVREFCSNQCIAPATFYYWKKKLNKKPGKRDFIPLLVKAEASISPTRNEIGQGAFQPGSKSQAMFELVYPNGTLLRITSDLDLAHLRTLIHLYD